MKKILHVVDSGGFYGKERVVLELIRNATHNVGLINLSDNKKFERILQEQTRLTSYSFYMNGKESLRCLKYQIMGRGWDIIHSHGFKESFWSIVYSRCFPNRVLKIVRTLHGYTVNKKFSKKELYRIIDKTLLPLHDKVVSVTTDLKYPTIWNGISLPNTQEVDMDTKIVDFCKDGIVIGTAARLSPEKNQANLIRAISRVIETRGNVKLLIMGDGSERTNLENLIDSLGIKKSVMLAGFVNNPAKYYRYLRLYIQPSIREGLPMSVLEAAALRVPMILTSVGGMELFINENSAIRTDRGVMNLVESIRDALDLYSVCDQCSKNAWNLYQTKFTSDSMTREYDKLYEGLK